MNIRRTRTLVAAPVLLLALSAVSACGSDSSEGDAPASGTTSESTSESTPESTPDEEADGTLALTIEDSSTLGKCAVPSAETLATFGTAFEGTVTAIEGGTVTLSVDQWYAGDEAGTVTVQAPGEDLSGLLMGADFQQGQTYLVSAEGDRVTLCGFSGEKTPELETMYAEAYGS